MTDATSEPAERSMRNAARTGGRWSMIENFGAQAVATVMTLVLARLLAPEDFGIIAKVSVVTNALAILTQFGFSASLIQRNDVTDEDRNTMFWVSTGIGLLLAALGAIFASQLASIFGDLRAAGFIAVAVIAMPFNLAGSVFRAVLVREFRFRPVALASALGTLAQAVVAITLAAFFDAGAWAIIIGKVFRAVFVTGSWAISARWVPRFQFSWERFMDHLSFNAGWGAGSIAMVAVKNVDYIIIANLLNDHFLGVYYVAYVLPDLIRLRVLGVFRTALFPILSRMTDQRDRFAAAYLQVVQVVALLAFPVMVGLALVADPLTNVAFAEKFAEAAAPMALVSVAAGFDAIWQVVATAFSADGAPGRAFWIVMVRLTVLVGGLLWLVPDRGLMGAGIAVLAASVVAAVIGHWRAAIQFKIPLGQVLGVLAPVLLPVLAMAAAVSTVGELLHGVGTSPIVALMVMPVVGAGVYFGTLRLAHRRTFNFLFSEAKQFLVPSKAG